VKLGRRVWLLGLAVTLLVAGVLSRFASSAPDGLTRVAIDQGLTGQDESAERAGVLSYDGVGGLIGVAVVLGLGLTLTWALRRRATRSHRGR